MWRNIEGWGRTDCIEPTQLPMCGAQRREEGESGRDLGVGAEPREALILLIIM